ncbi:tyrosine-type recombinase/integrase [Streptomyces niveus]|uniref:tyrosine-type recombinase/integrase n=1 Tax=Streptomyces niveus TaxID=193462 RepID=UPI00362C35F0
MAYIARRKNAAGEVTSYQVKWRLGGSRSAPFQTERFDDEPSAETFRGIVDGNGQLWPPGWVKGKGYIDPAVDDDARYVFATYAAESIKNRTDAEERYKSASRQELETYLLPTFANCDVRSTEHFSKATVGAWVNQMKKTKVWRGSKHKEMSPKTLKNIHGLLSSILREAMLEEPPLRARNPCDLTKLPRTDDGGVEDDGSDEDMTFLVPEEVEAIVDELARPEDKKLVRVKYATGFRWGELTALARRHAVIKDGRHHLRVTRAWKWNPGVGFYLGKPKSKRSRRTIRVAEATWTDLIELGLESLNPGDLVMHNGKGERLPYSTFYDRWQAAVTRAHAKGTLSPEKHPTLHDLRHSHAAALLSAGRGLTYVQRRLGHESITTTSDRYGHLLPEADDDAMETIQATLAGGGDAEEMPVVISTGDARRVYAVHLGGRIEGFWDLELAQAVAAQWKLDRGDPEHVEAWSAAWWTRSMTGGLRSMRSRTPERLLVWQVGPALYAPDGTEHVRRPEDHEPRALWVWDWEERFTEEPAVSSAEWLPGGETEASAWGLRRDEVVSAYETSRSDALRVCGLNPALAGSEATPA